MLDCIPGTLGEGNTRLPPESRAWSALQSTRQRKVERKIAWPLSHATCRFTRKVSRVWCKLCLDSGVNSAAQLSLVIVRMVHVN